MNLPSILTLFAYNDWANHRILTAAARVTLDQFITPTAHNFGSLRGTLVHILDAEIAWRMLCQHNTLAYFDALTEAAVPTLNVLQQLWQEQERAMRDYLTSLTDDDLNGYVRYTTSEGDKRERLLWHCLYHLINHGTQHRSEAAAILTGYGHSEDGLDFTQFLNEP